MAGCPRCAPAAQLGQRSIHIVGLPLLADDIRDASRSRTLRRVDPGCYETTDGSVRVVRVANRDPEAPERVGALWSWIATRVTKREALAHLNYRSPAATSPHSRWLVP
ncbi:hypothetical protein GCM10009774_25790 [Cellulomonas gelida]|uniref:Uncharacterized protein n=1 Tax=Cellulomonas gelida TaxID=1712 RepID=A0A4Y3KFN8_9CELL|nr:hypothetical protein CGE01nite_00430 [Cellulomonas gelida]GGL34085.1 hypothetical protein GCM10009774_25790 [Cellulomonas gelida]